MKEKTRGKRLFSILLCLIMALSLVPATVFAATSLYTLSVRIENGTATGGNVRIEENGGQGTVAFEENISLDAVRTVRFYPATGYEIDSVTVNGTAVSVTDNKLVLTMDANKTVVVKFRQIGGTPAATGGTSFRVSKTDDSNPSEPLKGAQFSLVENGSGTGDFAAVTDANGIAVFTGIPDGTYTLYESRAPYGYIQSDDQYTVTINTDHSTAVNTDPITVEKINAAVGTAPATFADGALVATFMNEVDENEVGISFPITKTVIADKTHANQQFQFELLRIIDETDQGEPIFEVIKTTRRGKNDFTVSYWIPESEQNNLAIREKREALENWTFDETVYLVNIDPNKTDNYGNYIATYTKLGDERGTSYNRAVFTNTYGTVSKTVAVSFRISKTINGNHVPADQKFRFEVLRVTGQDNQGEPIFEVIETTAPNKSDFSEVFQLSVTEQDTIAIREKKEDITGWTFDETVYLVTWDSTRKDQWGNLLATYKKYEDPTGPSYTVAEFVNSYKADDNSGATVPKTGDNSNVFLWGAMLLASAIGLICTALYGIKKKATK